MYKKIALTVLIITLVVLAVAIYVFNNNKEQELLNNYQITAEQNAVNKEKTQVDMQQPSKKSGGRTKEQLESEIDLRITIKGSKIAEESRGRNYTDDELDFISDPRLNIIKNMEATGEISVEELKLLNNL